MRKWVFAVCLLLWPFLVVRLLPRLAGAPPDGLVNALDRGVQAQFAILPEPPEMLISTGRMVQLVQTPAPKRPRHYQSAIDALRAAKWEALFYLATPAGKASQPMLGGHAAGAPVFLTNDRPTVKLPTDGQLFPKAPAALAAFRAGKPYTFRAGDWHVVARPVPASKQGCLGCHPKGPDGKLRRLGDTLGVAMYAFAPARER